MKILLAILALLGLGSAGVMYGAPAKTFANATEVAQAQETYKLQTGRYLQVLKGNVLPHYETGTVSGKLGKNLPDTMLVNVYEIDGQLGFEIQYEDAVYSYSYGFGPQSSERTSQTIKPIIVASSTP